MKSYILAVAITLSLATAFVVVSFFPSFVSEAAAKKDDS